MNFKDVKINGSFTADNVVVGPVNLGPFIFNIPPTTKLSLVLSGAQLIFGELQNAEVRRRFDRLEQKLGLVLDELGIIKGQVVQLGFAMEQMQLQLDAIDYKVEVAQAMLVSKQILASLDSIQARWPTISRATKNSPAMTQLLAYNRELEQLTLTLVKYGYADFTDVVILSFLVQRDFWKIQNTTMPKRIQRSYVEYFESVARDVAKLPDADGKIRLKPGDSLLTKSAKLLEQMRTEWGVTNNLETAKFSPDPSVIREAREPCDSISKAYHWEPSVTAIDSVIDLGDYHIPIANAVCFVPSARLLSSATGLYLAGAGGHYPASMLAGTAWRLYAHLISGSEGLRVGHYFLHPKAINVCHPVCLKCSGEQIKRINAQVVPKEQQKLYDSFVWFPEGELLGEEPPGLALNPLYQLNPRRPPMQVFWQGRCDFGIPSTLERPTLSDYAIAMQTGPNFPERAVRDRVEERLRSINERMKLAVELVARAAIAKRLSLEIKTQ